MDFGIRDATRGDCAAIMELVRELAAFERAPAEVTASLEHFEDCGFGEKPIWWGFVATAPVAQAAEAVAAMSIETQDPLLVKLMENVPGIVNAPAEQESQIMNSGATLPEKATASAEITSPDETTSAMDTPSSIEQNIQLPEAITPVIPEALSDFQAYPSGAPEQIVAFALYYIRYSTWKGRRMYLEDLYVTEKWRGKGVGTALMDALIGRAKAENLHGISWQVLEWNEAAMNFYKRYNARFDSEWINVAIDV